MIHRLSICHLLISLFAGALSPIKAQDAGNTEQILLDRLLAGVDQIFTYQSFVANVTDLSGVEQTLAQDGIDQEITSTNRAITSELTIIRGDNPNGAYQGTVTLTRTFNGNPQAEYTVDGQLIYTDGILYGQAAATEGEADHTFPSGFSEIPNPESNVFANYFEVSRFANLVSGEQPEDFLLGNLENLRQNYTSITAAEVERQGQTLDSIIFRSEGEALEALMRGEFIDDAQFTAILDYFDDTSYYEVEAFFDEAENLVGIRIDFSYGVTQVDLHALDPVQRQGRTLTLSIHIVEEQQFSQINEFLEPIPAPEQIGS
jgi:hypothetical protein